MDKYKELLEYIKQYNSFLITSHIRPEGDSLGSQLAFSYLLKSLGKNTYIFNSEKPGEKYNFLPRVSNIHTYINSQTKYDAVCFLDCAEPERIGNIYEKIDKSKPKINIDHHLSNTNYGDINIVEPGLSSTGEMIYHFFKKANIEIDKEVAVCIYTAILADTGSFRYSNVTPLTHKIASELIETGIDINNIYRGVYEEFSLATIRLLSNALATLKISKNKKLAWIKISKDLLKKSKARIQDEEDFINFPRALKGVEVAMLFSDIGSGKIKVSFRSNGSIDVNEVAMAFNGGGHMKASGCTIKSTLPAAEKKVLKVLERYI